MSGPCRLALSVRASRNRDEVDAAFALRRRVFCEEQGVDEAAEFDGLDEGCTQIVALDESGVVATCRLRMVPGACKLERMAVEARHRRSGVGAALLAGAEAEAGRMGAAQIVLNAQTRVEGFYTTGGYAAEGELFFEEGIEHVRMRKPLAPGEPAPLP